MDLERFWISQCDCEVAYTGSRCGEMDEQENKAAFDAARSICREHARSFYFSSFFLPEAKRDASFAVYAFCRLLDDATDEAEDAASVEKQIGKFCQLLDDIYDGREPGELVMVAFAHTVRQYSIPKNYFVEIADGCRMDLTISRYQTWKDLQVYCYRVAGVVGLIMSKIFGLDDPAAEAQAIMMGEAMQLTNILRDVKEDFLRGRIYLPMEDFAMAGYSEQDLAKSIVNESFRTLMKFEIARARDLYCRGAVGLRHLHNDGSRFTATSMGVIYAGILKSIERRHYNVFSHRARLNFIEKLSRLPAARRLSRSETVPPDIF